MKSGHDYLQCADVAVWMTIGVIAMAVAGFALLGPFELNLRSFLRSRAKFCSNFSRQKLTLVLGVVVLLQPLCLCQKQP